MWTFIIDFPSAVAEKKVRNGIPKCPHVIPAKSNKGLGIEAHNTTVINPNFFKLLYIIYFILLTISFPLISFSMASAWEVPLLAAAAFATKYGGNSPMAVPNPHKNASN